MARTVTKKNGAFGNKAIVLELLGVFFSVSHSFRFFVHIRSVVFFFEYKN